MIYRGNAHLGPLIHTFSIPASATCPSDRACLAVCYALGNLFRMGPSLRRYQANWENALEPAAFTRSITAEIRWKLVKTLRIHVAALSCVEIVDCVFLSQKGSPSGNGTGSIGLATTERYG